MNVYCSLFFPTSSVQNHVPQNVLLLMFPRDILSHCFPAGFGVGFALGRCFKVLINGLERQICMSPAEVKDVANGIFSCPQIL